MAQKEKPLKSTNRLYEKHRRILKKLSKRLSKERKEYVSEAQVNREAIECYDFQFK